MARGETYAQIAEVCDVSTKSIQRWVQRADFAEIVRNEREHLVPAVLLAQETLVRALSAERTNGTEDWPIRVAAAKALLSSPVAEAKAKEQARVTTIYLPNDKVENESEESPHASGNGHASRTDLKLIGPPG